LSILRGLGGGKLPPHLVGQLSDCFQSCSNFA
jgi:hypothetical protein